MTKSISQGYTDTAIGGFSVVECDLPPLNWGADFKVLSNVPGEVVATNLTSPVDQAETFRWSQKLVPNVYSGTDIDPTAYLPSRRGTSTLIELRGTWVETDSVDPMYRKAMPFRCGIVIAVPSYGNITATMVLNALKRTVSAAFEQGVSTDSGINALQHGVMLKSAL